ncbi:MAG: hypothetical protein IPP90_20925 [Gemmatimonadaceae bacterium]|nr:hypothetical protein [Gemmatimonadaceae bacterium]
MVTEVLSCAQFGASQLLATFRRKVNATSSLSREEANAFIADYVAGLKGTRTWKAKRRGSRHSNGGSGDDESRGVPCGTETGWHVRGSDRGAHAPSKVF